MKKISDKKGPRIISLRSLGRYAKWQFGIDWKSGSFSNLNFKELDLLALVLGSGFFLQNLHVGLAVGLRKKFLLSR